MSALTGSTTSFDRDVQNRLDELDADDDLTGWYCVATDPFPCPIPTCSAVSTYMTAAHRIVVWERLDDPRLLSNAQLALKVGRNPKVVEYRSSMGPCISFDQWEAIGRPIHGRLERPSGWPT